MPRNDDIGHTTLDLLLSSLPSINHSGVAAGTPSVWQWKVTSSPTVTFVWCVTFVNTGLAENNQMRLFGPVGQVRFSNQSLMLLTESIVLVLCRIFNGQSENLGLKLFTPYSIQRQIYTRKKAIKYIKFMSWKLMRYYVSTPRCLGVKTHLMIIFQFSYRLMWMTNFFKRYLSSDYYHIRASSYIRRSTGWSQTSTTGGS